MLLSNDNTVVSINENRGKITYILDSTTVYQVI